jgi:hypothetical protein
MISSKTNQRGGNPNNSELDRECRAAPLNLYDKREVHGNCPALTLNVKHIFVFCTRTYLIPKYVQTNIATDLPIPHFLSLREVV